MHYAEVLIEGEFLKTIRILSFDFSVFDILHQIHLFKIIVHHIQLAHTWVLSTGLIVAFKGLQAQASQTFP